MFIKYCDGTESVATKNIPVFAAGPVGRCVGEKAGGLGGGDGGLDRRGKSGRCGEGKPPARALAVCGAVRGDELDVNNSRQHL